MLEQIKMPADGYKVKVIYYLNPHLIWIEVCDPNVTTDEYIFEQIGLYGILPLETTLDIEEEVIKVQKCHDWIIAATTLMTNELKGSTEVWFTPTYIDRRTSIFDDNIHKYGELIIKSKNGELKQLSKLLINSNIAHFDVCEFHQKLSSGEIKTKLCSIKTQNVVKEIENYYTRTANSKITCKKAIAKQTSVFQIGQGLESALTVSNLERHNNKMLNTVLENKMKDLELCKDVDDESIGCGFRKSKDRTLETLSLSSVTIDSKCNDTQELDQTFKDIKVFLDANAKSNNNPSGNVPEAVKISVDVKKPHGSMLIKKLKIMNQADRDKINKVRMKHKLNIEQQIDKTSISTVKPIEQKDRPIESNDRKMQVVYDKDDVKNVAYGPPGMDPKLWKIEVVKQDSQGDVTEVINVGDVSEEMESESRNLIGEVDSELSFEITNKKTLSEYCNTKLKNEVTSELSSDKQLNVQANSKVALSYDNDDSSEIHKSSTSSLLLNKKLRAYSNMSKRNRSLSGSDTSNKDSSSVSDTNSCLEKDVNDDVRDVIKRIAEQYKVIPSVKNKKKQNDVTPTRLKINVNPFKNIDPNISVFVDKLVAPILLVHTKKNKRIQPIFEMRDVFFNSHIHIVLKNMLIEHPMMVQSVSWNTILRGHSLFMISPPNSGKTLGYLPAVCRLISDVYTGNVDSVGPLCIIVCATAKSVTIVEEMAKMFLGLDDKILACYAGVEDFYITSKLLNGCDLLISTPASLIRLMQLCEFGVDFRRLSVFVFDDCERLAVTYADEIKFFLFKIKETVSSRANNELKVQYILASRVWCDFFQPLAKKTPDTVISFSAFQECVPYSKADTSVSFVEIENKINMVFEFLQGIDESKKTVIVCKSDDEVDLLETALKRSKRVVFACNNNMTVHDLYNLSISWAEFEEPLVGPILVCCDGNLTHMNITDAHHLIHYSLPQLFSMFCKRFCVLNDNYPSIFKDDKKCIKIKILLDGSNVEQLPKIMNFIKRCTNNSPKFLDDVCNKILKDKDWIKAKNYIPICNNLLMFGTCPDIFNCKERHTIIKEYDSPLEWMPKDGIITFKILHYHSAILYSARLLTNVVNGVVTKYPQSYSSLFIKMGMYYSKESNRRLHGIPKIGDVCAASVKLNFYVRCQVVKILSHYQNGNPNSVLVNLIDEEKYEITRDIYLYYLPEELKEIKTPVVQVRLANVEPKDKDITFSNLAVEQFKKITDNNDLFIKGHVSLTLGNCVFVDTLEVCQELTSLNETVVKNNLKQELLENHAQLNPERLQQLKKLCTESGICYTEIVKEPEIQNPVKNLPKGSWAHLESGILSTVFLSSAKSPDKFFVRLNKFESCMSVLLQDIKEYSEAYISNNELSKVKEGDLVLAEFPDDSTYERARIDGINDDKAKCFFLDQGDWIEIPMEHIIPITEKFINKLPFQAIECRLIGIEPPGEEWSDFSKNWFCNNCFEDKNGDLKHLYIKYFTKEAAEFTGGYKYGVALIDTNTPNDVVINQLMIDLNLAKENIKEREYLNKLLPDAKESGHEQTFEEENSYLNLHPDTNESDHVETFEEVENEDDDEKMTKINQDRGSAGNSTVQIPQPIRSVPLVDSDSSDFERWDVNLDQSVLSTLFPRINSNIQAKVTQDTDDDVSTDENQVIPFRSRETNTEVNIQIKQNDPQELDSDDFTSSETSQTFNVCNDKQNLLSVVEQKRRPKLLWRQTKNVVFVKIELIAVKEYDLEFDVRNLKFSCNLNDATYEFDIELYGVIDRDKSSHLKTGFNIIVKLVKVLKTKWVSLTKSFDTKNWIAYDADSIDTSSDEEEVDRSTMENIIKVMHGTDDESDDDEFLDDVNYEYGKHN
ncbi:putative ATP-dependent RNA helicase TDRD12 isoform X1 [Nymphalis io]|uniref:putative ATP-dependent RNA helicase TDRD12 isoform X1 n=1 Tax=Inachis io TaxID=171585 RepID=UPI00216A6737|nr:putative ATP-dependent RNA helicase TDRD12 isoform X1 [Nymphalis io]